MRALPESVGKPVVQTKLHKQLTRDQRITLETLRQGGKSVRQIAFTNPYRSCERGTCENTIGLLRQYFPKKMPLDRVDLTRVGDVERALNGRPRKSTGISRLGRIAA